jgi:tRNA(adenine34) deaminase
MTKDEFYMQRALCEAKKAYRVNEVPVGAVIVKNDVVISARHNLREATHDPTAHAELLVIRDAAEVLKKWRLQGATLYVTKEPCPMCAGAICNARIAKVVYGCKDEKGGAVESLYRLLSDERLNHQVEIVEGIMAEESAELLKTFFQRKRDEKVSEKLTMQ